MSGLFDSDQQLEPPPPPEGPGLFGGTTPEPVQAVAYRVLARKYRPQTFDEIRKHAARELQSLPAPLRELEARATYPVQVGKALTDAAAEFDIRLTEQQREP